MCCKYRVGSQASPTFHTDVRTRTERCLGNLAPTSPSLSTGKLLEDWYTRWNRVRLPHNRSTALPIRIPVRRLHGEGLLMKLQVPMYRLSSRSSGACTFVVSLRNTRQLLCLDQLQPSMTAVSASPLLQISRRGHETSNVISAR